MKDMDQITDFDTGDRCPVHNTPHRKVYTFGSTMTAETEVCTFFGCPCTVSISHDPVGTYPSVARYHTSYGSATGVGRLRAMEAAVKYR